MQFIGQRDQVDGLLAFAKRNHVSEYTLVLGQKKIFGTQRFHRSVQRMIVEENRAEHGAFGVEIIRQRLFESGVGCHAFWG